jgi:deoxyadenosine/deoxycytidine kinase
MVDERYQEWYDNFDICPKIQIDGDRYDFVADPQAAEIVIKQIKEETKKLNLQEPQSSRYSSRRSIEKGIF